VVGPADPFEPHTPLQDSALGYQDGLLTIVGAELGAPDTRPAALLPFAAPVDSASATSWNVETNGQAWLEVDTSGLFVIGGNTGITRWTFHAGGTTLTGTYTSGFTGFTPLAVSYDPVAHVASAAIAGQVVASVPYAAQPIEYVGVEGSLHANVDNFTVRAGGVRTRASGAGEEAGAARTA
jgi:hypothetical protein